MEEDKIVLDRKSFEALAVDSRVRILKSLKERRKTLSEIAKEQKMSLSGVKEHLEILEKVGLIEKIDDGHKWKYYELTKKGRDIVAPRELRVWILLSLSTIALVASMFVLLSPPEVMTPELHQAGAVEKLETVPAMYSPEVAADAAEEPESAVPAGANGGLDRAAPEASADAAEAEEMAEEPVDQLPAVPLAVAVISGLTLLGSVAILVRNRMR